MLRTNDRKARALAGESTAFPWDWAWAALLFPALCLLAEGLLELPASPWPIALGEVCIALALLPRRRWAMWVVMGAALIGLLFACLCWVDAREGVAQIINRLFRVSEARNRYVYTYLSMSGAATAVDAPASPARLLLALAGAALVLPTVCVGGRLGAALWAVAICGFEVFFGVAPDAWRNILAFGCFAALFLRKDGLSPANGAWLLACALCLCVLLFALFPGVNAATEQRSERVRDWLSRALHAETATILAGDTQYQATRREGLLTETHASGLSDALADGRGYERALAYEEEISNPRAVAYMKIALLLIGIVALFLVPFLPFYWLDRRKRRALALRAAFDASDSAQAVCAMVRHIAACLSAMGAGGQTVLFSKLAENVEPPMPAEYLAEYCLAMECWHRAAYGDAPVTKQQRDAVASLLRATEATALARADRKQRFRLRYIDCLILTEDAI